MDNNYDFLMVNPNTLYGLYQCNEANDLPDLTIGMAYYREQHPEITQAEDDAMIGFISRHSKKLARAYPNKPAFYRAWSEGITEDLIREQEKEDQAETAGETE